MAVCNCEGSSEFVYTSDAVSYVYLTLLRPHVLILYRY